MRLAELAATYSPVPLRQSTIGAEAFHFRVRDGIGGAATLAITTRSAKRMNVRETGL